MMMIQKTNNESLHIVNDPGKQIVVIVNVPFKLHISLVIKIWDARGGGILGWLQILSCYSIKKLVDYSHFCAHAVFI